MASEWEQYPAVETAGTATDPWQKFPAAQSVATATDAWDNFPRADQGANIPTYPTQVVTPPSSTPATDAATDDTAFMGGQAPAWAVNLGDAISETAKGLPQMLVKFPEYAYHGAKIATGQERLDQSIKYLVQESAPQAAGLLQGIKSPVGSKEFDAAVIQLGMMAAPAVDLVRGLRGAKPPVQVEAPPVQTAAEAAIKPEAAPVAPETAPAPETPTQPPVEPATATPVPAVTIDHALTRGAASGSEMRVVLVDGSEHQVSPFAPIDPDGSIALANGNSVDRGVVVKILEDGNEVPVGGEANASSQPSTASVPEPEVRAPVGEETPLRQPGETAQVQGDVGGGQTQPAQAPLKPDSSGKYWYGGSSKDKPTNYVTNILEHAERYAKARQGGVINVYTPEQVGESAFTVTPGMELSGVGKEGDYLTPQEFAKAKGGGITTVQTLAHEGKMPEPLLSVPASEAHKIPELLRKLEQPAQEAVAPTGISKAAIEEQRGAREVPDIERQKQIDFGAANDRANEIVANDPSAPTRLVDELAAKPRALNPEDTPLIIRRVQETQAEFDRANKAVNEAATPEERTVAQERLNAARAEYDKTTEIAQNATSRTGAGLNSLKMLLNEDYSLAKMESRRRAANKGAPLSEQQIKETAELHKRIADLEQKIQLVEKTQATRQTFAKTLKEGVAEARAAGKAKRSLVDFLAEKEAKARERIIARRGRLNVGFDPSALSDEIIIGASHIAKGLQDFGVWSERMVTDFGDRIKPMLRDIWLRAKAYHTAAAKALRSPEEVRGERYKTVLAKKQIELQAKLERGDFTRPTRAQRVEDRATFRMKANLQQLKNQFERAVAKEAYRNKTPGQKFWDHFVGVERAMKLSGPEVFGKLGMAALVRETLAPIESGVGYGVSKMFPRLAKGTRYGAGLGAVTKAEIRAKVAMLTKGISEFAQNVAGKETELEAMGEKYGRGPTFWYSRIGKMHAAIKAPIKRAEFERSMTQRMDAAIRNGEDVSDPAVLTRLANESVLEANRAIFQQNTVVSKVFSTIEKTSPVAGRVARFLFPVVKIPTNIFKEFVGLHAGAPVAATKIGMAYWKGIETLAPLEREAIIRQLVKGSIGGAGLLWAYYNHDKVQAFFKAVPAWFQHTPMAMVLNEGSYLWDLQHGTREEKKTATNELKYMAKTDIPFMYTITDAADALNAHDSTALLKWVNNMTQSTVVPQLSTQVAKAMDKPGTFPANMAERPTYRVARNPVEAVKLGIPVVRTQVPQHSLRSTGTRAKSMPTAGVTRSRGKGQPIPR